MLDAWRPGRAFPGLRRWWKHFKMTDLQWALNFLHYWLCQRRFQRQLPWCELISSCWLPRGHTQRWCTKPSFAASALPLCFLQPSAVAAVGSSSQALTTSKKNTHCEAEVTAHMTSLLHTHINGSKTKNCFTFYRAGTLHFTICKHTQGILCYTTLDNHPLLW